MWKFRSTIKNVKQRKEYKDVGEFLLDLRKSKNLTQSELAKAIDASNQAVSKWENNNGFPDVLYQTKLCDVLGISLEELHNGNFNYSLRRKNILVKLTSYIVLIFMIIFIPLFICLSIYFFNTYNTFHIYEIYNADKNEVSSLDIKGIYSTSKKANILYISSIEPFMSNWNDNDMISIDIYHKNEIIYHSNNYEDLIIKLAPKDKINLNNLVIKASVNNETDLYVSNIDYNDIYKKSEYDTNLYGLESFKTDDEIVKSLLNAGFSKNNDNEFEKKIKGGSIIYYLKERKLYYNTKINNIVSRFIYFGETNILDVFIYQRQNDINVTLEKYTYNLKTNKINCFSKKCYSYKNVLETLEKYLILLFVE